MRKVQAMPLLAVVNQVQMADSCGHELLGIVNTSNPSRVRGMQLQGRTASTRSSHRILKPRMLSIGDDDLERLRRRMDAARSRVEAEKWPSTKWRGACADVVSGSCSANPLSSTIDIRVRLSIRAITASRDFALWDSLFLLRTHSSVQRRIIEAG